MNQTIIVLLILLTIISCGSKNSKKSENVNLYVSKLDHSLATIQKIQLEQDPYTSYIITDNNTDKTTQQITTIKLDLKGEAIGRDYLETSTQNKTVVFEYSETLEEKTLGQDKRGFPPLSIKALYEKCRAILMKAKTYAKSPKGHSIGYADSKDGTMNICTSSINGEKGEHINVEFKKN